MLYTRFLENLQVMINLGKFEHLVFRVKTIYFAVFVISLTIRSVDSEPINSGQRENSPFMLQILQNAYLLFFTRNKTLYKNNS